MVKEEEKIFIINFILFIYISLFFENINAEQEIQYCFKKYKTHDRGILSIFLINKTKQDYLIDKIQINTHQSSVLPDNIILWKECFPNPILPKVNRYVFIKLNRSIKIPLEVVINNELRTVVFPVDNSLKINGIYFSDNFKEVFLYVFLNNKTTTISKIYLNGNDVTDSCFIPSKFLKQNNTAFVKINLNNPLTLNEYIFVKVETEDKNITVEDVVKVNNMFTVSSWDADTRQELNFDSEQFMYFSEKNLKNEDKNKTLLVFQCPNCNDAGNLNIGYSAKPIQDEIKKLKEKNINIPYMVNICGADKERAYFVYAGLVDVMTPNPYAIVFDEEPPEKNLEYYRLCKIACEPKPMVITPEAFRLREARYPMPEEERLTVYYGIASGSKGVLYYTRGKATDTGEFAGYACNPELEKEIGRINKELQTMKKYLRTSEPIEINVRKSSDDVDVFALQCEDRGFALILVNKNHKSSFSEGKVPFEYTPQKNVSISIELPDYIDVKSVFDIEQDGKKVEFEKENKTIKFVIDKLEIVKPILLINSEYL